MHGGDELGHMGVTTTFRVMRLRYYWWTMYTDIKSVVSTCEACQSYGKRPGLKYQLYRIPPPVRFGVKIGVDFVNDLPGRYSNMLSFVCYLTSWAESWPCKNADTVTVIKRLDEWRHRYGAPETIITDNGPAFRSAVMTACCDKMGTDVNYASTHYAKTNGKVEKYQGVLCKLIAKDFKGLRKHPSKWHECLPKAVWSWRTQPKDELGTSPYLMVYGQKPRFIVDREGRPMEDLGYTEEELRDI